jgi:hypothetical protein
VGELQSRGPITQKHHCQVSTKRALRRIGEKRQGLERAGDDQPAPIGIDPQIGAV